MSFCVFDHSFHIFLENTWRVAGYVATEKKQENNCHFGSIHFIYTLTKTIYFHLVINLLTSRILHMAVVFFVEILISRNSFEKYSLLLLKRWNLQFLDQQPVSSHWNRNSFFCRWLSKRWRFFKLFPRIRVHFYSNLKIKFYNQIQYVPLVDHFWISSSKELEMDFGSKMVKVRVLWLMSLANVLLLRHWVGQIVNAILEWDFTISSKLVSNSLPKSVQRWLIWISKQVDKWQETDCDRVQPTQVTFNLDEEMTGFVFQITGPTTSIRLERPQTPGIIVRLICFRLFESVDTVLVS